MEIREYSTSADGLLASSHLSTSAGSGAVGRRLRSNLVEEGVPRDTPEPTLEAARLVGSQSLAHPEDFLDEICRRRCYR